MGTQISQPTYNECRKIITRVVTKLRRKCNGGFWAQPFPYHTNDSNDFVKGFTGPYSPELGRYTTALGPHGQPMFNDAGELIHPIVFRTAKDDERLKKESIVDLSWGGNYEHAQTIRRLFEEEGVNVEWAKMSNGTNVKWDKFRKDKIRLYFGPKKGRPRKINEAYLMAWCRTHDVARMVSHDEHGQQQSSSSKRRRSELVQKIGAILDENTSVLKENDYRVCMDTLMELM